MSRHTSNDRRDTQREDRVRRRHVLWNKLARRQKPRDGWVCNISRDGLAMLVRNGSRPKVGDQFEVEYHGSQLLCTVVRRQGIEQSVSVLGCRAEVAGGSDINAPGIDKSILFSYSGQTEDHSSMAAAA